ncbi:hypothetical protein ACFQY4_18570 [Catellatospora bangladeshensis]|uniref:hypothetical protein n=1 Tax=Catellatospora bangladeshensis TaxID=310355 RepID=UPI003623F561
MSRRPRWRAGLTAAVLLAALAAAGPAPNPALADTDHLCRFTFTITTGGDGIRDDSEEMIFIGNAPVVFEDADGDGTSDDPGPIHKGGTGDRRHATHVWHASLERCQHNSVLTRGFTFMHTNRADDHETDNWDLVGLRIVDRDTPSRVYYDRSPEQGLIHRFSKNANQTWNTGWRDLSNVCRVTVTINTGPDGIGWAGSTGNYYPVDARETITLGGRHLFFEDYDGDGAADPPEDSDLPPGRPYHEGGRVYPAGHGTTYVWQAALSPCVPNAKLIGGFDLVHTSARDDWDLTGLRIVNRDTDAVYVDLPETGTVLHRFVRGSDAAFNTNLGRPLPDPAPGLDTDHDGLTDAEELHGLTAGGQTDPWLAERGADPCRETVAVEIDWLYDAQESHQPAAASLAAATYMFDRGDRPAYPCPYGYTSGPGVQLLIDLSDGIDAGSARKARLAQRSATTDRSPFDDYRAAHFRPIRDERFFYNLWGYAHNETNSSGVCCFGPNSNDFMVTLGAGNDALNEQGLPDASAHAAAATFVHELGHALTLRHGGDDDVPYKPNYQSVMNYRYSSTGIPDFGIARAMMLAETDADRLHAALEHAATLDYSRAALNNLDPHRLDERTGIGAASDYLTAWWDAAGTLRVGAGSAGLDWNFDDMGRQATDPDVEVDIIGQFQVCITGFDPTGGGLNTLQTRSLTTDFRKNQRIYAGSDGRCDTPPWPPTSCRSNRPAAPGRRTGRRGSTTSASSATPKG